MQEKNFGKDIDSLLSDPLLPGANSGSKTQLNLSPRMAKGKAPAPGMLKGDKSDPEEAKKSRNSAAGKSTDKALQNMSSQESDSFFKMYNREIKVNQDEIPIILAELTDAAYNFIQREQYEKALILLQKTEGVLEVVTLENCARDKFVQFITYNNMSMCFQKLNMLEECLTYLKESIKIVKEPDFLKGGTVGLRMKKLRHECKLKLQLCAILSQTQSHTDALNNAFSAVKLCHQLFKDLEELCQIYIDKINFRETLLSAQEQSDLEDEERETIINLVLESSPAKQIPKNFLEKSVSLIERSSQKLLPVVSAVRKRMAGEPYVKDGNYALAKKKAEDAAKGEEPEEDAEKKEDKDDDDDEEPPDMRSVLGFLNQQEWISNLNIGNIMQIQAFSMKDFMNLNRDEGELNRENFLERLSILTVSYFCMSTEMRFLLQLRGQYMKEEVKKEKELQSEYWHAKALEISCTFLPSECPLLNHILLSYQKHHDPAKQPIKEDQEQEDQLSILRPIKGIDQSKYQPIIRQLPITVKVSLSPNSVGVTTGLKTLLQTTERELVSRVLKNHLQHGVSQEQRSVASLKIKSKTSSTEKKEKLSVIDEGSFPVGAEVSNLIPAVIKKAIERDDVLPNQGSLEVEAEDSQEEVKDKLISHKSSTMSPGGDEMINMLVQDQQEPELEQQKEPTSIQHIQQPASQQPNIHNISAISKASNNMHHLRSSSIEGLAQQLMDVAESPPNEDAGQVAKGAADWLGLQNIQKGTDQDQSLGEAEGFNSQIDETMPQVDSILMDPENDTQLYDHIISKLIDNPRIDKKALLERFISKIEMETNSQHQRQNEQMANLKDRTDHIMQSQDKLRQNVSQSNSGNMSMIVPSNGEEELVSISEQEPFKGIKPKRVRKIQGKDPSSSVQQIIRKNQGLLSSTEEVLSSEAASEKVGPGEKSSILPQTRIRQKVLKPKGNATLAHNTSKTSQLSKTTGTTKVRPATSLRTGSGLRRPASKNQSYQTQGKGTKTRKQLSYIDTDPLLNEMIIDDASHEEEALDFELENKSSKSRSRVENASIMTINQDYSREQKTSQTEEGFERKVTEAEIQKQHSSQKKSQSKTRPSSGITNFTRSSSNLNRRRRQQTAINGIQTAGQTQSKRMQKNDLVRVSSIPDRSRSDSDQRRTLSRGGMKRAKGKRNADMNTSNSSVMPVQKFLQENSKQQTRQKTRANKENSSLYNREYVIENDLRPSQERHQTSQQVLPGKRKGSKQKSIIAGQATSCFDSAAQQHNMSQQCLPSHKQSQLLTGAGGNISQKRLRQLLGHQQARPISGGYKTSQQPRAQKRQAGSNFASAGNTNHLSSTKPRATHHQTSSQAINKNVLLAQLSDHLRLASNSRGRSKKRKRQSPNQNQHHTAQVTGHHRNGAIIGGRSGGKSGDSPQRFSSGSRGTGGSSHSRTTERRCFACSNSGSAQKRHHSGSLSGSQGQPRRTSVSDKGTGKYSSKRRSANGKLEFKKQNGSSMFNVITNSASNMHTNNKTHLHQSSLCDLKRQVMANQKILMKEMSGQSQLMAPQPRIGRSNSSETKRKPNNFLAPAAQKSDPSTRQSQKHLKQSLEVLLKKSNRPKSTGNGGNRLRVPDGGRTTDNPRVLMSKSLHFLQNLAKKQQLVSQNQLRQAAETQQHAGQNQQFEEEDLTSLEMAQRQRRASAGSKKSVSQGRTKSQGRSQSPPHPNMARIPKKKNFSKVCSHAQIFSVTAAENMAAVEAVPAAIQRQHGASVQHQNYMTASGEQMAAARANQLAQRRSAAVLAGHQQQPWNSQDMIQREIDQGQPQQFSEEDFEFLKQQERQQTSHQSTQNPPRVKGQVKQPARQNGQQNQRQLQRQPHGASISDAAGANFTGLNEQPVITKKEQRPGKQVTRQGGAPAQRLSATVLGGQNQAQSQPAMNRQPPAHSRYQEVNDGSPLRVHQQKAQLSQLQQQQAHLSQQQVYMR